jgi:hypothetical protein
MVPEGSELMRLGWAERDWVAPWKAPGAPGKIQRLINGQPLATTFDCVAAGEDFNGRFNPRQRSAPTTVVMARQWKPS